MVRDFKDTLEQIPLSPITTADEEPSDEPVSQEQLLEQHLEGVDNKKLKNFFMEKYTQLVQQLGYYQNFKAEDAEIATHNESITLLTEEIKTLTAEKDRLGEQS
jgi:hypothetical protein